VPYARNLRKNLNFLPGALEQETWSRRTDAWGESKIFDTGVGRNWAIGGGGIYFLSKPATGAEPYSLTLFSTARRTRTIHSAARNVPDAADKRDHDPTR